MGEIGSEISEKNGRERTKAYRSIAFVVVSLAFGRRSLTLQSRSGEALPKRGERVTLFLPTFLEGLGASSASDSMTTGEDTTTFFLGPGLRRPGVDAAAFSLTGAAPR